MLPNYGGEKVKLGEQELYIFRESDIIAKMEWIPKHSWLCKCLFHTYTFISFINKIKSKISV